MMKKFLIAGAGLAAIAAAPAAAQYQYGYQPYGTYNQYGQYQYGQYASPYGYQQPYGNAYGYYNAAAAEQMAAQRCSAEVETRLHRGTNVGGILAQLLGARTAPSGHVVSVNNVKRTNVSMRVRGLASSGRYAYNNYGPYGYGAYGGLGYGYANSNAADLTFKCDVDYRGRISDVDIYRR